MVSFTVENKHALHDIFGCGVTWFVVPTHSSQFDYIWLCIKSWIRSNRLLSLQKVIIYTQSLLINNFGLQVNTLVSSFHFRQNYSDHVNIVLTLENQTLRHTRLHISIFLGT